MRRVFSELNVQSRRDLMMQPRLLADPAESAIDPAAGLA